VLLLFGFVVGFYGFRVLFSFDEHMGFSIVFHHMGKFERSRGKMLCYEGGEKHVM